ncbi:MAG: glycosyltransferase [Patescibacteria group bacterium]
MKFSFIIPVKEINDYIREAVPKILEIECDDFEIIIYPDEVNNESWPKTRQIATGHVGPAIKRSLAIKDAAGEIIIFIDDDAYPEKDFLDKLEKDFDNKEIGAVGGPAVTPKDDNFLQKVSGAVFLSSLSGGCPERYISIGQKRLVNDWPSVNLSIRKELFAKIGGFNSEYWPGEDTLLCLGIIKAGEKILYDPELIVYHHRRAGFLKHMKQVGGYGLHRGFFAKKFPETSLKLKYFIPSLFLLFVVCGVFFSLFSKIIANLFILGLGVYLLGVLTAIMQIKKYETWQISLATIPYIIGTHLVYGYKFLQGLFFTKELKSKLR